MGIFQAVLGWFHLNKIYAFNQTQRNRWVEAKAAEICFGARVLDVGAGSCPYRELFKQCDYKTHDFGGLSKDQRAGEKGYGQIDYKSDILSIPVPDRSFDIILCTEVLEHVPEPINALFEFSRILKPGGRLILTAPLGSGLHQEPYHFYGGFTPYWYRKFLTQAGFHSIIIESNGGFFKHYGQESIRYLLMLAPWRCLRNVFLFPLWLISLPWLALFAPLIGFWGDGMDNNQDFTVGYHVTALRCDAKK
jgi:ubiquinone/menaquinone biosynthesis C-methylase UbiE